MSEKEENKDILKESKGKANLEGSDKQSTKIEDLQEETNLPTEESEKKINLLKDFDLEDFLGEKGYDFYLKNKFLATVSVIIIGLILVGWFSYSVLWVNFVVNPNNEKSIEKLWQAENSGFDKEDWNSAIYGDSLNTFDGFSEISKEYGGYHGGDLALYDLGIAYLNNENYDEAIETLKKVDFDDEIIGTITFGALGDAYMQKGNITDAYIYYEKAYKRRDNELTTPVYMMKAAFIKEMEKDYDKAKSIYQELIEKYPNSPVSVNAEKYLETLKLGEPIYQLK